MAFATPSRKGELARLEPCLRADAWWWSEGLDVDWKAVQAAREVGQLAATYSGFAEWMKNSRVLQALDFDRLMEAGRLLLSAKGQAQERDQARAFIGRALIGLPARMELEVGALHRAADAREAIADLVRDCRGGNRPYASAIWVAYLLRDDVESLRTAIHVAAAAGIGRQASSHLRRIDAALAADMRQPDADLSRPEIEKVVQRVLATEDAQRLTPQALVGRTSNGPTTSWLR